MTFRDSRRRTPRFSVTPVGFFIFSPSGRGTGYAVRVNARTTHDLGTGEAVRALGCVPRRCNGLAIALSYNSDSRAVALVMGRDRCGVNGVANSGLECSFSPMKRSGASTSETRFNSLAFDSNFS